MLNVVQKLGLEKSVTLERLQVHFATKGGTVTRDLEISNLNRDAVVPQSMPLLWARRRINVGIQPRAPINFFPSRVRPWFRHLRSIRRNLQWLPQAGNFHVRLHAPRVALYEPYIAEDVAFSAGFIINIVVTHTQVRGAKPIALESTARSLFVSIWFLSTQPSSRFFSPSTPQLVPRPTLGIKSILPPLRCPTYFLGRS